MFFHGHLFYICCSTYPGRRPIDGDKFKDSNCNGIFGINSTSGLSYEEELCAGSGARGIIYIGDSVGNNLVFENQMKKN